MARLNRAMTGVGESLDVTNGSTGVMRMRACARGRAMTEQGGTPIKTVMPRPSGPRVARPKDRPVRGIHEPAHANGLGLNRTAMHLVRPSTNRCFRS